MSDSSSSASNVNASDVNASNNTNEENNINFIDMFLYQAHAIFNELRQTEMKPVLDDYREQVNVMPETINILTADKQLISNVNKKTFVHFMNLVKTHSARYQQHKDEQMSNQDKVVDEEHSAVLACTEREFKDIVWINERVETLDYYTLMQKCKEYIINIDKEDYVLKLIMFCHKENVPVCNKVLLSYLGAKYIELGPEHMSRALTGSYMPPPPVENHVKHKIVIEALSPYYKDIVRAPPQSSSN